MVPGNQWNYWASIGGPATVPNYVQTGEFHSIPLTYPIQNPEILMDEIREEGIDPPVVVPFRPEAKPIAPAPEPEPEGMSTGAKVAIGVGVATTAAAILTGIVLIARRK